MRMVFGQDDGTATKQMALEQSHGRLASLLTIYMISSNSDQSRKVVWCFSEIPSRVYALQPDDFFSVEQGRCESIGIDRLACLRAAGDMVGFPALVIDAGTCMTYTACDDKGHIVGGGITLGLAAKFAAVAQSIKDTPGIVTDQQHEEMIRLANDIVDQNKPLDFFCRGLNEAVVSSTLREVAFHCRKIIKTYLDNIYAKASPADKNDTHLSIHTGMSNVVPKIIFTGPDSMILSNLLTREENHLIAPDNDIRPFTVNEYKHLLAFGIASALQAKVLEYKLVPCEEFDKLLIGCRVAKQFTVLDEDGDCIYRGTIASSVRSKQKDLHNYLVLYDDVDTEELNLVQIHGKSPHIQDACLFQKHLTFPLNLRSCFTPLQSSGRKEIKNA
jgi:transcriptional antiterminator Rof (Rho-off)